jgi:hypothetical protein
MVRGPVAVPCETNLSVGEGTPSGAGNAPESDSTRTPAREARTTEAEARTAGREPRTASREARIAAGKSGMRLPKADEPKGKDDRLPGAQDGVKGRQDRDWEGRSISILATALAIWAGWPTSRESASWPGLASSCRGCLLFREGSALQTPCSSSATWSQMAIRPPASLSPLRYLIPASLKPGSSRRALTPFYLSRLPAMRLFLVSRPGWITNNYLYVPPTQKLRVHTHCTVP